MDGWMDRTILQVLLSFWVRLFIGLMNVFGASGGASLHAVHELSRLASGFWVV